MPPCARNHDPLQTAQWLVTPTCFLFHVSSLLLLLPRPRSHSCPAEVEDINSTIIGEPGKPGRWYVPRIFQTSFNNFAVNLGQRGEGRRANRQKVKENGETAKL